MSNIQAHEVKDFDDFRRVVDVEHEAYHDPPNSFWEILRGPTADGMAERQWAMHNADKPSAKSTWVKAVDNGTGEILGAVTWTIYDKNPYDAPGELPKATWWPEVIDILFVGTQSRRRGAGRALMQAAMAAADARGLEAFVESTDAGKPLYEVFGFHVVDSYPLEAQREEEGDVEKDKAWEAVRQRILPKPMTVWVMWRPAVGSGFVRGETPYPWEQQAKN